jgi:hypothetical protein
MSRRRLSDSRYWQHIKRTEVIDPAKRQGPIDTGDVVFHHPTGENWVVAYVRDGRLAWIGWPKGEALLADCELREPSDDAYRMEMLQRMAQINADDARGRYARHRLATVDGEAVT